MNMMLWLNIVFLLLAWRCFVYLQTAPTTALHHGSEGGGFWIPSAALSTRHSDWTRGTPWVMSYSRLCPTWCRKVKMEFSGRGQNWVRFLKLAGNFGPAWWKMRAAAVWLPALGEWAAPTGTTGVLTRRSGWPECLCLSHWSGVRAGCLSVFPWWR